MIKLLKILKENLEKDKVYIILKNQVYTLMNNYFKYDINGSRDRSGKISFKLNNELDAEKLVKWLKGKKIESILNNNIVSIKNETSKILIISPQKAAKLRNIKEDKKKGPYIQRPKPGDPEMSNAIPGYAVTKREEDPETGTSTTYLEPEPKLLKWARDIARMKKQLKHYLYLPDSEKNEIIKNEAKSIFASLKNAEGKLRQLYERIKASKEFGNND